MPNLVQPMGYGHFLAEAFYRFMYIHYLMIKGEQGTSHFVFPDQFRVHESHMESSGALSLK